MKILIMSVTAGEGHNSTAKAMKAYFDRCGAECIVLDTYKYINPAVAKLVSDGYLFISTKAKGVMYKAGYRMAEKRGGGTGERSASRLVHTLFTDEVYDYISEIKPDAVVFTHAFAGMILDIMKEKNMLEAKTVGVVTDFVIHPYWEECLMSDYIVTASPMLNYQAKQKGFDEKRVLPYGIPIGEKFALSGDKAAARVKHGLDPDLRTVLIMGGSMGYGHLLKNVRQLDKLETEENFQIIAACGNNEEMREKIDKYARSSKHRIVSFGFVNFIDELMDASDVIVSTPGGLTTSEALAKRLPMIMVNPIPGQENRNASFLLNNGAALSASSTCSVAELVYGLFNNPSRMETLRNAVDALRHPDSTKNVCDLVLSLAAEGSGDEIE